MKKNTRKILLIIILIISIILLIYNLFEYINAENLTDKQILSLKFRILSNFSLAIGTLIIIYNEKKNI